MNTHSSINSIPYQKIALLKFPRTSLKILWLLSILSMISLLVFYIFQINTVISGKYLVEKYKNRLIELSMENKNLEINSVHTVSLGNVLTLLESSDFEKASKVHYIQILGNKVITK